MFISIRILPLQMMSADAHNMKMSANVHIMMMSADAYSMTSRVFIRRMTLWGFTDLQTSLQISLA